MALQTSGPISFADIAAEFGLSLPVTLSALAAAAGVAGPPYGMGSFYGKVLSGPFNVGSGSIIGFDNPSLTDFVTAQGIFLSNNDTTVLYVGGGNVYRATLSTAGDISTATLNQTVTLSGVTSLRSARFCDSGNKILICDTSIDVIRMYSVSTPYTLNGITLLSSLSDSNYTFWDGADISSDGTRVLVAHGISRQFVQYNLSTPFDLSTGVFASVYLDANSSNRFRDVLWVPNGTAIISTGNTSDDLYKYSLGTAFDLSTINSTPQQLDLGTQIANPFSVTANRAGTRVYVKNTGTGDVLVINVS